MPSWKELKRFCDRDGWELYKDTDHYFYRKVQVGGTIRRTKVSKGSGEIKYHRFFIYFKPHSAIYYGAFKILLIKNTKKIHLQQKKDIFIHYNNN